MAALALTQSVWAQEQVVIGGPGSMLPVAQALSKAFISANPGAKVEVISSRMGSSGGIKALEAGRITVALLARAMTAEEKSKHAYRAIGRVPVVFAVHKSVTVGTLKEAQLCDLYAGKIKTWSEVGGDAQKITALTRKEDVGAKDAVRKNVGCFKELREGPDTVALNRPEEMLAGLTSRPGTIGIVELGDVTDAKGAIKALDIDGVSASPEAVGSGKYKVAKNYGLATKGEPLGLVRKFIDFMGTPEGQKILIQDGIVLAR
jgi:phosphate transport system substrate-binding protein